MNLDKRNAAAAIQALNDFQSRILEMEQKLIANQAKIGSMDAKLASLEKELILMRTRGVGTGPTA